MLRRLWEWLSRWRPKPPPEASELFLQGRAALREWAYNKLRSDILAALQDDLGLERTPYDKSNREVM